MLLSAGSTLRLQCLHVMYWLDAALAMKMLKSEVQIPSAAQGSPRKWPMLDLRICCIQPHSGRSTLALCTTLSCFGANGAARYSALAFSPVAAEATITRSRRENITWSPPVRGYFVPNLGSFSWLANWHVAWQTLSTSTLSRIWLGWTMLSKRLASKPEQARVTSAVAAAQACTAAATPPTLQQTALLLESCGQRRSVPGKLENFKI